MKRTPADQPVAFVEIPKGSRNKYEYDERLGHLILDRTLYSSVVYPCDYGFLLDTIGDDNDPVDALILVAAPTFPGCLIPCDLVGVLHMRDEAGEDAKLICVPPKEPRWADVRDLDDLSPALRAEIQHFFEVYKALEPDKYSSALGMAGREAAWREIEEARANYGS